MCDLPSAAGFRLCRDVWLVHGFLERRTRKEWEWLVESPAMHQPHDWLTLSNHHGSPRRQPRSVDEDLWGQKGKNLAWVFKSEIKQSWWPPGQQLFLLHYEARELKNRSCTVSIGITLWDQQSWMHRGGYGIVISSHQGAIESCDSGERRLFTGQNSGCWGNLGRLSGGGNVGHDVIMKYVWLSLWDPLLRIVSLSVFQ